MSASSQCPAVSGPTGVVAQDALERAIDRHNARVASRVQRAVQVTLWCYVVGPIAYLLLRLLFRIRVVGAERLTEREGAAVFAAQHCYEWDSFVTWLAACWPRALLRWRLVPMSFVGRGWMATRTRRSVAWTCGLAGLHRGRAREQSAFAIARALASRRQPPGFVIFPTGPTGRKEKGVIRPGIGHLVSSLPGCRVHPVAVVGLRELRLRDVIRLRRPKLTVVVSAPVESSQLPSGEALIEAVGARVYAAWDMAERDVTTVVEASRPQAESARERRPERLPRRSWLVLAIAALGPFMGALDIAVVNIAFPAIESDISGASREALSWILDGYAIVLAAFVIPAGRYADIIGIRRTFCAGFALFTAASVACAIAGDAGQLVAARLVQGLGAATMAPAAFAVVLREFPLERRALAMSLLGASAMVAGALGPVVGGLLVEVVGWRSIFLVNLPIGAAVIVAARAVLHEARDRSAHRPDLLGAIMLAAGLALLATTILKGEDWGWASAETASAAALSIALTAVCLVRSRRHAAPAVELSLFRLPLVGVANAATAIFAVGFFGLMLVQVLFLTTVWAYGPFDAGLAIAPFPAVAAVAAGATGRYTDAHGFRAPAVVGPLVFSSAALFLAYAPSGEPDFLQVWLPGMALLGIGAGLSFPTHIAAAMWGLPAQRHALGASFNSAARQFGALLGFTLAVVLIGTPAPGDAEAAFERAFLLGAVSAPLAAALGLFLRRDRVGEPTFLEPPHARLACALAALGPDAAARALVADLARLAGASPHELTTYLLRTNGGPNGDPPLARELAVSRAELAGSVAPEFLRESGIQTGDIGGILRRACDATSSGGAAVFTVHANGWRPAVHVLPRKGANLPDATQV